VEKILDFSQRINYGESNRIRAEYDEALITRLREIIKTMNGSFSNQSWGIGGSQEITAVDANIDSKILHIESETYIGLTISGSADLVDKIASLMKADNA
jgi:hypothetical protein